MKGVVLVPFLGEDPEARPLIWLLYSVRFGSSLSLSDVGICNALLVLHSSVIWNMRGAEELVLFAGKYSLYQY